MKFMHISDLHLGRRIFNFDLLDDQKIMLGQLLDIAREQQVDGVLIAGDVYNRAAPSAEAMTAFSSFVCSLAAENIPAYIISGNHDSAERVSYFSDILKTCGVHVSEQFDGRLQGITLSDAHGPLTVHLLPFIKPVNVRKFYPEEKIESYEDAVRIVLQNSPLDTSQRNLLVAHQFIMGAQPCESEERMIGGLEEISASLFDDFDYVALGHLHGPQKVGRPEVRYCGSPLKYSFSEVNHKKSVTIVELCEKGSVEISTLPIDQPHEMREVKGGFEELINRPYSEDYMRVVLTDELPRPDAQVALLTVFPNMMRFAVENSKTSTDVEVNSIAQLESRTPLELFSDFYTSQNGGVEPTEAHMSIIREIFEELGEDEQ